MDEQERQPEDGVSIKAPGGWGITAHGAQTILALLVIVLIFVGYLHHQADSVSFSEAASQHHRMEEKFDEMIYVLKLSQPERDKLDISMPPSMRTKVRRGKHKDEEE